MLPICRWLNTHRVALRANFLPYNNGYISNCEPGGSAVFPRRHGSPMARSHRPLYFSLMLQSWTIAPKHNFQLDLRAVPGSSGKNPLLNSKKKYMPQQLLGGLLWSESGNLFDEWVVDLWVRGSYKAWGKNLKTKPFIADFWQISIINVDLRWVEVTEESIQTLELFY